MDLRVCVDVADLDLAVAFYRDGLGLTPGRAPPPGLLPPRDPPADAKAQLLGTRRRAHQGRRGVGQGAQEGGRPREVSR